MKQLIAAGLLITGLAWGITPAWAEPQLLDRVVAVVNDDIILESELERRARLFAQQLRQRDTQLPPEAEFRRQVLNKLIEDQLQIQQAEEFGFQVSSSDLDRTLERIADSNGLSLEAFKARLEAEGQNYRAVREQIRDEMLITQTRERLVNQRIRISEREVENFLASEQGRKEAQPEVRLSHIMIPISRPETADNLAQARQRARAIRQRINGGADFAQQAVAYSQGQTALEGGDLGWRNQAELPPELQQAVAALEPGELSPVLRMGSGYHLVKLEDRRGGATQMVDEFKARHILIKTSQVRDARQARALIQELYQRLEDGAAFADLAREYSDDPVTASQGGDLGWVARGQMVPAFEERMLNLPEGEISRPFRSRFGWHLLQVQERRTQDKGEDLLAQKARETLRQRKFPGVSDQWLSQLRAQAYIDIRL